MKWVLIVIGVLVVLGVALFVFGATRPKDHVATNAVRIAAPDSAVWATIAAFEKVPEWFTEVKSVQRIADVDGRPAYKEQYGPGFIATTVVRELVERKKIVREILPSGSLSGTWTIELAPAGSGTSVTITERGHVGNPLFRAMMAFSDPRKTMRQYTAALGSRLGVAVTE